MLWQQSDLQCCVKVVGLYQLLHLQNDAVTYLTSISCIKLVLCCLCESH